GCETLRQYVHRNFPPPSCFHQNVSRHTMKVTRRVADIASFNLRQSLYNSIDSFVCIVFGVTQALGHIHSYQSGTNRFVALTCLFAVGIEPFKQLVKWVVRSGQLLTVPRCWGSK